MTDIAENVLIGERDAAARRCRDTLKDAPAHVEAMVALNAATRKLNDYRNSRKKKKLLPVDPLDQRQIA